VDLEDISEMEVREAEELERGDHKDSPEHEEEPASAPEEVELREDTR
jgi:hypothetical protein